MAIKLTLILLILRFSPRNCRGLGGHEERKEEEGEEEGRGREGRGGVEGGTRVLDISDGQRASIRRTISEVSLGDHLGLS